MLSELETILLSKTSALTLQKETFEKAIENIGYYTAMVVQSLQTHTDHGIAALGGLTPTELSAVLKNVEPISLIPNTPHGVSAVVQTGGLVIELSKFGYISDLSPSPSSSTWTSTSVAKVKTDFHIYHTKTVTTEGRYISHQDCHYRGQVYITPRLSLQRAGIYHTMTVTTEGRYISHQDCHYRGQVYITPRLSLQRAGIYRTS